MDELTTIADLERRLAEAEAALRQGGGRASAAVEPVRVRLNAFLVHFQEIVRGYLDPRAVAAAACRLVTQELGADRAYWSEIDWTTREFVIGADYNATDAEPISGRFPLDGWEPFSSYHLEGRPVVVDDTIDDLRITPDLLKGYEALGIQADLAVPVLSRDKLRSVLAVNQRAPRKWQPDEVVLVQRAADWCWAEVERARAEAALRDSEDRQAFLLKLSDTLRQQTDAASLIGAAARLLGEKMGASRIMFAEFDVGRGIADIFFGWFAEGAEPFPATMSLDEYKGPIVDDLLAGRTVRIDDTGPPFARPDLAAIAETGVKALLSVPIVAPERGVVNISVHQHTARHWTDEDVALVNEAIQRLWSDLQRMRSEGALRVSEERFRQFATASAAGLWMRDADTLAMEFVSPAIATIYGVDANALLGDVTRWAALIVPDDRGVALAHLDAARAGEVVVHEFRIRRPLDGAFRWIRNTGFPLRDSGHIPRVGGITEDVTETRRLTEHQGVLLAELQHRVRNIMAMVRSIANRTAPGASCVEDYRSLLEGRLLALARVQALLTREANTGGSLKDIIESEVAAQAHHGGQHVLTGPDTTLSPKAVEVLTLAFHELATNALKYGALSVPEGRLIVTWTPIEKRGRPWLSLDWIEENVPSREPSSRRGFGSELIEARIPYELGGRGAITIEEGGARCHLEFPLKVGESILETDAPQPTTVFGGSLDMSGAPDLTGRKILVVEDDYFLATDTAVALRGAGAIVLGPCPTEERVHALLEDETPTHAVLDLNLGGGGPRFEIAQMLTARGVPFVFLTGYDPDVIPPDLAHVVRLQKPLPFRAIVEAVGQL